jgi:hypothetical protein
MNAIEVLASWAVQDSPPGAAIAALVARGDVPVGWLDRAVYEERTVVALYNARSATAVVPAADAAAYGTAQLPVDDAGYKALLARAAPEQDEGYDEPAELAYQAISEALDGRERTRDDLHEQLRRTLPNALLPWCESCGSHHARRGLLIVAGLRGRLCISGRAGRQPVFARTDQLVGWAAPPRDQAGAEHVRRYRGQYGDPDIGHFTEWVGLGRAHARELWTLAGDAMPRHTPLPGLRLLAPGDPVLLGRDRETLLPDTAARKKVWASLGGMGIVLADGEAVALWRGRKRGKTLDVTLEPLRAVDEDAVRREAERLAPHRGCAAVHVHS